MSTENCPFLWGDPGPWESIPQTASQSVHVFAGFTVATHRKTQTDNATSVAIGRILMLRMHCSLIIKENAKYH